MNRSRGFLSGVAFGSIFGASAGLVASAVVQFGSNGTALQVFGPWVTMELAIGGILGGMFGLALPRRMGWVPWRPVLGASLACWLASVGLSALPRPVRAPLKSQLGRLETAPPIPSLVLIGVEGLGVDALDGRLPALAALAEQGVVFDDMWATSDRPRTALASLLTGRLPAGHGAGDGTLRPGLTTLAGPLAAAGVRTAAVVHGDEDLYAGFDAVEVVSRDHLFDVGDRVAAHPHWALMERWFGPEGRGGTYAVAERVAETAERFLSDVGPLPVALFVHLRDPGVTGSVEEGLRMADQAIGRIEQAASVALAGLELMFVVVGITGGPGAPLSMAHTRVPLIVRLPGGDRAGEHVDLVVSGMDAAPGLLDALGPTWDRPVDGSSLLLRLRGEERDGQTPVEDLAGPTVADPCDSLYGRGGDSFVITSKDGTDEVAVRGEDFSAIANGGERVAFYDRIEDPSESNQLSSEDAICGETPSDRSARMLARARRMLADSAGREVAGVKVRVNKPSSLPVPPALR